VFVAVKVQHGAGVFRVEASLFGSLLFVREVSFPDRRFQTADSFGEIRNGLIPFADELVSVRARRHGFL
jgi:hypothetical protein